MNVVIGKFFCENSERPCDVQCPPCVTKQAKMAEGLPQSEASLHILPIWKKGLSAEDWFLDMAVQARKYPDRFQKMILTYQTTEPKTGNTKTSYYCYQGTTTELIGLLEVAKMQLMDFTTVK